MWRRTGADRLPRCCSATSACGVTADAARNNLRHQPPPRHWTPGSCWRCSGRRGQQLRRASAGSGARSVCRGQQEMGRRQRQRQRARTPRWHGSRTPCYAASATACWTARCGSGDWPCAERRYGRAAALAAAEWHLWLLLRLLLLLLLLLWRQRWQRRTMPRQLLRQLWPLCRVCAFTGRAAARMFGARRRASSLAAARQQRGGTSAREGPSGQSSSRIPGSSSRSRVATGP